MVVISTQLNAAPLSDLQLYGSYSRMKIDGSKETWDEVCDRTLYGARSGLFVIGRYTPEEQKLIDRMMRGNGTAQSIKALGSGRWLWCGGTEWLSRLENWHGAFNCVTRDIRTIDDFGICMNLSMQGCGVGTILEPKYIKQLPTVKNALQIEIIGRPRGWRDEEDPDQTIVKVVEQDWFYFLVGDSRQGWVKAYQGLIELACSDPVAQKPIRVQIDLDRVRPSGEPLQGFGGVANPIKLGSMFERVASILNKAVGRQLNSLECCLLIDEAGITIVAGGVRRVAGMRQIDSGDSDSVNAKMNLWVQNEQGQWKVDPEREALKVGNHTRVFHHKPTKEECIAAVRSQYECGEGAIQWAGEAVLRANADILTTARQRYDFLEFYTSQNFEAAREMLIHHYYLDCEQWMSAEEAENRMGRYGLNPCGELIARDNHCNLATVHLTNIDPANHQEQEDAFAAAALNAVGLLHRNFQEPRFGRARQWDPIILVSFTQGFEFFARLLGMPWLRWWQEGRPAEWGHSCIAPHPFHRTSFQEFDYQSDYFLATESQYLGRWSQIVHRTVEEYCRRNHLKSPNRCTGLKPEGSLTLLTGTGMCGLHPPKSWRYIRRKEFPKNSPIALAAVEYGFNVVPSNGDKAEDGTLLSDPFDPACTGWVVEVPVEEKLIHLFPEIEAEGIDPSKFSCLAQLDWIMQVQKYYSTHNTSCTPEIREHEVEEVGDRLYQLIRDDEGYISMAFLARFDDHQTFPRMPFEPISLQQFEIESEAVLQRRTSNDFNALVAKYLGGVESSPADSACSSDRCGVVG